MRTRILLAAPLLVVLAVLAPGAATAQTGVLAGVVSDAETGAPLQNAAVQILGAAEAQAGGVFTTEVGQFRFTLSPGTYSLVVSMLGYETARVDGVRLSAGDTQNLSVQLTSRAFLLNPIVVTASRREEKALSAPASVSIVGREAIEQQNTVTPADHVKGLPGVDVAQTGIQTATVVSRGFNNVFSGALLVITDNRYAHVPSLRFNAHNMVPVTDLDLDRIEVVLGPGSALYGPNSASGVMHLITTSPIDAPGTGVSLTGGERSVFQGSFRHASLLGERAGLKVSGMYFRGDDWEFIDPEEERARQENPDDPRIGNRDFGAERWGGEVRLDLRPWDDGELIFNVGVNTLVSSVEMTGIGGGQTLDWRYMYYQSRLRKGRFFGQVFLNTSDAGDTYLLRTGLPILDKSRMVVGQLQHGLDVGERQSFTYGLDLQWTEPRTEGSITGRNEDDDEIAEIGGYLHSETRLSEMVDLVAALRVDNHNRLEDPVFSPRAAIVFRPAPEQNLRITANRAFSTPTTNNLFLDLLAGRIGIPPQAPLFGYDVRTLGVPEAGFTFDERCPGGVQELCMWSPLPGAPNQALPANAALFWDGLVMALAPEALRPFLLQPGTQPGDPAIGSVLRRFNQEASQTGEGEIFPLDAGPEAIGRMKPTITNTFEVGYKGVIADRVLLSADVYHSRIRDFIGPLRVETPNVFLDPQTTAAFVQHRLGPLIQAGVVTPAQVQAIVQGLAGVPVGTVAPDQSPSTDLILTYRNFGEVNLWGADFGAHVILDDQWSLRGTLSLVNEDCFAAATGAGTNCEDPLDIALNAPKTKGSLSVGYDNKVAGVTVEGRARFTSGFPMNSGVYVGTVEGYTLFDANLGYRLPNISGARVNLTGTNLLNNEHRQFVGAPELGRLLLLRLSYQF